MPVYVLTSFLIYAVVNAFTPGPGNILALNTVTNYGWKKGEPLFLGIFTGYYVVQIICALFVYGVGTFLPDALQVMSVVPRCGLGRCDHSLWSRMAPGTVPVPDVQPS